MRPYQTSTTLANLRRSGRGVFHVTDDVLLLVQVVTRGLEGPPPVVATGDGGGWILSGACRWYALRVRSQDDSSPRATWEMEVVEQGRLRDWFGWNRAKHAVVEAAILATRLPWQPADEVRAEMARLRAISVSRVPGLAHMSA